MSANTMSKSETTVCQCWGGSTHGTDDPSVRLCDLCGGTVPTDPASGNYLYLPRATGPAQQQTTEPHIDAWFDEPTMYLRWTRLGKLEQQWRVTSYSKGVTVGVDLQWREVPNA